MEVLVNYGAVFLAALSSMVVGAIWYAPAVFGKPWMSLTGVKMNKPMTATDSVMMYGTTFIASLITAYVLAHVTFLSNHFFHNSFMQDAMTTAFWLWLGFTAARFLVHDIFEGRRKKLTLINAGHELVTVMAMALVIGLMGV
jgi:hypothetical protein